jgi:hypothetical protein
MPVKIRTLVKAMVLATLCTLPASAQAAATVECKVVEVAAFKDRVHVKCSNFASGPRYFAVPTSSPGEAAHFITMASLALGGYLWVESDYYDLNGPSFGCQLHDCRPALSFRLYD